MKLYEKLSLDDKYLWSEYSRKISGYHQREADLVYFDDMAKSIGLDVDGQIELLDLLAFLTDNPNDKKHLDLVSYIKYVNQSV